MQYYDFGFPTICFRWSNDEEEASVTIKYNELKSQSEQQQEELRKVKLALNQKQMELDALKTRYATLEQMLSRTPPSGSAGAVITTGVPWL